MDIKDAMEFAFRKGFSHGFSLGIRTQPENFDRLEKEIREWRYDFENNEKGPPGTRFENIKTRDLTFHEAMCCLHEFDAKLEDLGINPVDSQNEKPLIE